MISIEEYNRRVAENTIEYQKQLKNNDFNLKKFHGFDIEAGIMSSTTLSSKAHDIRCAVILGFLPILTKRSGADAIKLEGIIFTPVELKSTFTDESKFYKTIRNTIYSVSPGSVINGTVNKTDTTILKSSYNATYNIKDNISSKGIDTYIIIFDSRNETVIDCYEIAADDMKSYLNSRTIPESGSLTIKLSIFLSLGKRSKTLIPTIGFDNWVESLLPYLPLIRVISPKKKPKAKQRDLFSEELSIV